MYSWSKKKKKRKKKKKTPLLIPTGIILEKWFGLVIFYGARSKKGQTAPGQNKNGYKQLKQKCVKAE